PWWVVPFLSLSGTGHCHRWARGSGRRRGVLRLRLGRRGFRVLFRCGARLVTLTAGQQFLLPVGEPLVTAACLASAGLALALLGTAAGTSDQPGSSTLGNHLGQQRGGPDRIVVAGNRVVDLVRVTVGVENRDHRNAELACLADGDVFLLGVDDPDGAGDP